MRIIETYSHKFTGQACLEQFIAKHCKNCKTFGTEVECLEAYQKTVFDRTKLECSGFVRKESKFDIALALIDKSLP